VFSLIYNVIGVTLAATGVIGPLGAAILMPLSSLTVVISSYRARTFALPKSKSKSDTSLARVPTRPAVEGASS
jgi:Cu2+-exporting ATPase